MPPHTRLQRWIDLLAALLARNTPATFEQLARAVPEYARKLEEIASASSEKEKGTLHETLKRAFERDKKELRELGVAIESLPDEDGNESGTYRLRRKDFYLPYLCLAVPDGEVSKPERVDRWGYHALTSLTFEADELQAVVDAAASVRALGDPLLAAEAESALRKLAVDLPVGATAPSGDAPHLVLPRTRADVTTYEEVSEALGRRKRVRFTYHAMSTDRTEGREVEPYGLFFESAHWYLVGRDTGRGELRNFRLDRIRDAKANTSKAGTPDYTIPGSFRLREHARSRQAWELGDSDALQAIVRFVGSSGPARAARKLGEPVDGDESLRAFSVRRGDPFVRWVLSFAGELVLEAPPELVQRYANERRAVGEIYEREGPATLPPPSAPLPGEPLPPLTWQPVGAAAQLRRILHVVPQIADGEEHAMADVAERVGTSVQVLRRDLYSLVERYDVPGGFVEGVTLYLDADNVSAHSDHFLRPMRLTVPELCALDLGLAVLRARRAPDEYAPLDRARERLGAVIAQLPGDPLPDGTRGFAAEERGSTDQLVAVRAAVRERKKLRIAYRRSGSATATTRVICPIVLVAAKGSLYLVARCDDADGMRVFRIDRMEGVERLDEGFEVPDDFSVDSVLSEGKVFSAESAEVLTVRYSPKIARWIAEREGLALERDGSLVVEHPLADVEWGVRHVLQYGAEAEALGPTEVRERIRDVCRG